MEQPGPLQAGVYTDGGVLSSSIVVHDMTTQLPTDYSCSLGMLTCLDIEGLCHKVEKLENKMPEKYGIAEGSVLGPIIFKMCILGMLTCLDIEGLGCVSR